MVHDQSSNLHCTTGQTETGGNSSVATSVPRPKRGGFAPAPPTSQVKNGAPIPKSDLTLPNATTRKRKRQIGNEDDREERALKQIQTSQHNYNLTDFQDLALQPAEAITIGTAEEKYELPNLLNDYRASTHPLAASLTRETVVEVWRSIRLQEPQRQFFPKATWQRAQACPATTKHPVTADPVLYVKAASESCQSARASIRLRGTLIATPN